MTEAGAPCWEHRFFGADFVAARGMAGKRRPEAAILLKHLLFHYSDEFSYIQIWMKQFSYNDMLRP